MPRLPGRFEADRFFRRQSQSGLLRKRGTFAHRNTRGVSKHAVRAVDARHGGVRLALPRARVWGIAASIAFWAGAFVLAQGTGGLPPYPPAMVNAAAVPVANAADAGITYPVLPSSQVPATQSVVVAPATWLVAAVARQPASVGLPSRTPPTLSPAVPAWSGSGTIPRLALAAYTTAAQAAAKAAPSCRLSWALLAGIGLIESDHARGGGSSTPNWSGVANPPILGPLLDGNHAYPAIGHRPRRPGRKRQLRSRCRSDAVPAVDLAGVRGSRHR